MDRAITAIARFMAILGGLILLGLISVTTISIAGRILNTIGHNDWLESALPSLSQFLQNFGSIEGDFELVETGVAIAIVAFFPWCSISRNHAMVDVFTLRLSRPTNGLIDFVWEVVFTIVLFVLAWRLFVGTFDKMRYGETTFLLQFPIWWGYIACAGFMAVAALVSLYVAGIRFRELHKTNQKTEAASGAE